MKYSSSRYLLMAVGFAISVPALATPLLNTSTTTSLTFDVVEHRSWTGLDLQSCTRGMRVGLSGSCTDPDACWTNAASGSNTSYYTSSDASNRYFVEGCSQLYFFGGGAGYVGSISSRRGSNVEIDLDVQSGVAVQIVGSPGPSGTHWIEYTTQVTLNRDVKRVIFINGCAGSIKSAANAPDNSADPIGSGSVEIKLQRYINSTLTTVLETGAVSDANDGAPANDEDAAPTVVQDDTSLLTAGTYYLYLRFEGTANRYDSQCGGNRSTTGGIARIRFEECLGDWNGDQTVDFSDYLDFVSAFSGPDCEADFNYDGSVDFFDYLDFISEYNSGC